jgi:hypothetical protein
MNASFPIPTGLHPSAQQPCCEERATLGNASPHSPQPQRGCGLRLGPMHARLRSERASSPLPSPPWHGGEGIMPRAGQCQDAPSRLWDDGCNPVGVVIILAGSPRVARASQPWTESRSPVGANSQPGGLREGSRWSFRAHGETTTGKPRRMAEHPGGVPDPARTCYGVARSSWLGSDQSGTHCRGADSSCAITRRSPPPKPMATSRHPLATLRVDLAGKSKHFAQIGCGVAALRINASFP